MSDTTKDLVRSSDSMLWHIMFTLQDSSSGGEGTSFCLHIKTRRKQEARQGQGSGEDDDDEDVIFHVTLCLRSFQWKACVCVCVAHVSVSVSRPLGRMPSSCVYAYSISVCVCHMSVCDSPMSRLRVRGLHCLCPLQPLSSMSSTCS